MAGFACLFSGLGWRPDWKETYFLSRADKTNIEKQAIHAYNWKIAA